MVGRAGLGQESYLPLLFTRTAHPGDKELPQFPVVCLSIRFWHRLGIWTAKLPDITKDWLR